MAENSKIEWTTHTFNPWEGCTKVSPGCQHCYAEARADRFGTVKWGPSGTRRVAAEAYWRGPVKWNREAAWCGNPVCKATAIGRTDGRCACGLVVERPRVFCASLADVFEARITMPPGTAHAVEAARLRLFNLIRTTPNLDWLLVTKRPENVREAIAQAARDCYSTDDENPLCDWLTDWLAGVAPRNVWLGASVENQAAADERIPHLLRMPAAVRFLSCEPLLEPVEFSNVSKRSDAIQQLGRRALDGIGWVIVGGESGRGARPCNVEWVRSIVAQCKAVGVATFIKQMGSAWAKSESTSRLRLDGKGGELEEWPLDLRIREFPHANV